MKTLLATAILVAGVSVCAAGTASAATPYECEIYAQNYAEQQYPTGGGAVAGAVGGGIIGGLLAGATGGKVGNGVGVGAVGGLVVGSVAWQNAKRNAHDLAYSQCMSSAVPVYAPAPPVYAPPPPVYPTGAFNGVIVGATSVNVRSGPGTSFAVIGQAYANQGIAVSSCGGGWCQVNLGPTYGFIAQTYIRPVSG